jgi:predicted ATPase/DNA-binding winged helix-turn-helix (wHTH) protein
MDESTRPGVVEILLSRRAVSVDGHLVKIGSRAFELLVAFAQRPGQLVTKAALIDAAWGHDDVGDFNLHVQIAALRKQFGKAAIVTIPGRGYSCSLALRHAAASGFARPAQTLHASPPAQVLFGREQDFAAVERLVRECALVVITGPGGVGKTSLARAVLQGRQDRHADGAVVVDLATLESASDLPLAVATALRVPLGPSDAAATWVRALRPLDALVMLDNAEALIDAVAATLATLLEGETSLRFLVTSQVRMKYRLAHHHRLEPLPLPSADTCPEDMVGYAAVALFDARVRAIDPRFGVDAGNLRAVVDVCRALDGLPLALELAAARCASVGLSALQLDLNARLRWPSGDARFSPDRQKTLAALMAWSHGLLSPSRQSAFRRLGVFVGGFTLSMIHSMLGDLDADAVSRVDMLAELVEHSLIVFDTSVVQRYRLLETARSFALEQLAAAELDIAHRLHARAMRDWFEAAYLECWHLPEAEFVARHEPELSNLRAALRWSLRHDTQSAITLAGASGRLWRWLSLHQEGLGWLERAAALIDSDTPPAMAARLWEAIALQYGESSSVDGRDAARRAAALCAQTGDRRGRYLALAHLAYSYRYVEEADEATLALDELQRLEDPAWPPSVRLFGARIERQGLTPAQQVAAGRAVNETRLALATAAGSDYEVNCALVNLADLALMAGDVDDAVARNRSLLTRLSHRHSASRAIALGNLLEALVLQGDLDQARRAIPEFVDTVTRLEFMFGMFALDALALLAALEQRWGTAVHLLGYSDLGYVARHRDRGPNERAIRDRAAVLVGRHVDAGHLRAWMVQGSRLTAAEACKLATDLSGR